MKGSLIIIGFFVLGTLCGIFHLIPVDAVMDSKRSEERRVGKRV